MTKTQGVTRLHTCSLLLLIVKTLYFLARVFPGIPLLLLSIVGFREFGRGISISFIYLCCASCFFSSSSRPDVTFTINELVGSNYMRYTKKISQVVEGTECRSVPLGFQ